MPRGGAIGRREPTDGEWKEAVRLWMRGKGWVNADLARELDVTPAAITHLFNKAVSSALRPRIDKLIGWPGTTDSLPAPPEKLASGTQRPPATSRGLLNSEQLAELISYFQALNQENKVRLLERAHTLWDSETEPPKGRDH